jgi:hypothetical protein
VWDRVRRCRPSRHQLESHERIGSRRGELDVDVHDLNPGIDHDHDHDNDHDRDRAALGSGCPGRPGPEPVYTVQTQPAAGSCHYRVSGVYPLPDPHCTPGATNPQVTQGTVASTICVPGYTSTIRPPESVTEPEKVASAAAYGYTGSFRTGEYDHLVQLELGGDPNDPANLWVEPNDRASAPTTDNSKDELEGRLHDLVCAGRLPLAAAQQAIAADWVAAYQTYG